jgi:hypothetical protein
MIRKTIVRLAALGGLTAAGIIGAGTVQAANPASFFHWAPATQGYTASTDAGKWVTFTARVPRAWFAPRDAQIDVQSSSSFTQFSMDMLVACTNNTGVSNSKTGDSPISSADDFTLTCPGGNNVVGVQGGLIITN